MGEDGNSPLAEEAIWLGRLVVSLLPEEPEAKGMLALMLLHRSAAGGAPRRRGDLCAARRAGCRPVFLPWAPIQDLDRNHVVRELANRHDVTPRQIVLAWLLARSRSILPIPGTASVSHLERNVAAAAITLTPSEVASITDSDDT